MDLALRPGLTFCRLEGNFIFLDREADRYFSVSGSLACCLQALLNTDAVAPSVHEINLLQQAKLIVDGHGDPLVACEHEAAIVSILGNDRHRSFDPLLLAGILIRLAKMQRRLRKRGLPQLLREIDARRMIESEQTAMEKLRELARLYDISRRLYLPADHCLVRALTLYTHAADIGFRVRLVFGVQLHPFAAHCWIEHGDLILDDNPDHVSRFKPILALQ